MRIMKKFVLLFLLIISSVVVLAEDEVQLEPDIPVIKTFNTGTLDYGNPENKFEDDESFLKPFDAFCSIKDLFKEEFLQNKNKTKN